ncbi:MAG: histidine kinase [Bacteroidales bacterium]|nr:histidine kinase [Bacteroidales bacterium]
MKSIVKNISLVLIAVIISTNAIIAQQYDSLFNSKGFAKLFYLDEENQNQLIRYLTDTSGWLKFENLDIEDLKRNNEGLIKSVYNGKEYDNPALLFTGCSSGFELYRDSVLIYAAGKRFNPENPGHYFDTHIIPLEKPLKGSVFILHVHFKSYLDIAGFTTALIGESHELAAFSKEQNRSLQNAFLLNFIIGIFLLVAGIFALAAFLIRIRKKDFLLFWFFVFACSQGYVFILEYLWLVIDIAPKTLISTTVVVENLVPVGIIGIISMITGFTKNIFIRIMIALHIIYTTLHLSMIHFDIYNVMFWVLVATDIVLFCYVMIKSKIYRNPDFKIIVIALCILMILVILDMFAVFEVFYIAEDLSSYGMLLVALSFAWYIERTLFRSRQQNLDYQIEIADTKNKLLKLENENVIAQYETLKNQVNPHFLFNSLNSLSSLIRHDDKKALKFIEEFSDIYRYVLDANDKTIVETEKEIAFVNSYVYLQTLRYGDNLRIKYNAFEKSKNTWVVPLSVQILVENAIKHNEISSENPLQIDIYPENDFLIVSNKICKLNFEPASKRIGLQNLASRYALITDRKAKFGEENGIFKAIIPLIKMEE